MMSGVRAWWKKYSGEEQHQIFKSATQFKEIVLDQEYLLCIKNDYETEKNRERLQFYQFAHKQKNMLYVEYI